MNEEDLRREEESRKQIEKLGLKLSNKKANVPTPTQAKRVAEQKMAEAASFQSNLKEKASEISDRYWKAVKDTTLEENKGPIQKSLEKEIVTDLINLANTLNADETQTEGYGSIMLSVALLRTVLYLRDENNKLAFKLDKLERAMGDTRTLVDALVVANVK